MFKYIAQLGRSKRTVETYSLCYVEALSEVRMKLTAYFNFPVCRGNHSGTAL